MTLLITYVLIALIFSFLCSIAEAVILSVTPVYIAVLEKKSRRTGRLLRKLKTDINSPLAAILTLNTIAHTVGAVGAGAQASIVFGSAYMGIVSVILTLLILIFSEILPKTLGAHYWQKLAPTTVYFLRILILVLYPFVKASKVLTNALMDGPTLRGFNREEFAAMADLSSKEGLLASKEYKILKGMLAMNKTNVKDAMTPRTVIFAIDEDTSVGEYFEQFKSEPFSRIPVYLGEKEQITGFVLRSDLLLAQAHGDTKNKIATYRREILALSNTVSLSRAFDELIEGRMHMALVVDEYGGIEGLITQEDALETLLGLEIVDERDKTVDMQQLARHLWRLRARKKGLSDEAAGQ